MFWSVPARGAGPPLSPCSEMSANWRAERAGHRPTKSSSGRRSKSSAGGRDHGLFLRALYCERPRRNRRRIGQTFGGLAVNISEIWQLRHTEEELRALTQSYNLKEAPKEILPFVITLEHATLRQVREALDLFESGLYPCRSGLVSNLGNEVKRGGRAAPSRRSKFRVFGFNVASNPKA